MRRRGDVHRRDWAVLLLALGLLSTLTACATSSRLHAKEVPAGSLRLAQVVAILTRAQSLSDSSGHAAILASGIQDSEIRDGRFALGRINCCWPPLERDAAIAFYIPPDVSGVELGDIVEVKSGSDQRQKATGPINTMTRIRQTHSDAFDRSLADGQCRWDPLDRHLNLYRRVLYCDWMKEEGWVKLVNPGLTELPIWFRPTAN